jgi:hypothetical protein
METVLSGIKEQKISLQVTRTLKASQNLHSVGGYIEGQCGGTEEAE